MKRSASSLLVAFALGLSVVFAHAHLERSMPKDGSVISTLPATISLEMTEAVELRFSSFKVYKLDTAETAPQRVNADAATLMNRVLSLRNDESARADAGLATTPATSKTISIKLKPNLEPGYYAVMWRVLSVDTHTTEDYIVFRYTH